jgi:hypothetical protein
MTRAQKQDSGKDITKIFNTRRGWGGTKGELFSKFFKHIFLKISCGKFIYLSVTSRSSKNQELHFVLLRTLSGVVFRSFSVVALNLKICG